MFFDVKTILRGRKRRNFDSIEIVLKFPFFWSAYCHISSSRIFKIDQLQKIDFFRFWSNLIEFWNFFQTSQTLEDYLSFDTIFMLIRPTQRALVCLQVLEIFKIKIAISRDTCMSRDSKFRYFGTIFDALSDDNKILIIWATFSFCGFYL